MEGETGSTFAARLEKQAKNAGVSIVYETVQKVSLKGEYKTVVTDKGTYQAQKVILANGTTPRKLGIPGEDELVGRGIGRNAAGEGANFSGKHIYVVGGADGAVKEALYLAQFAEQLTIIHFEEKLGCISEFLRKVEQTPNIEVKTGTRLWGVYGSRQIESLEVTSSPRFIEAGASSCEAGSRFSFDSTNVLSISELSPCVPRFYCWITRSLTASPHF